MIMMYRARINDIRSQAESGSIAKPHSRSGSREVSALHASIVGHFIWTWSWSESYCESEINYVEYVNNV